MDLSFDKVAIAIEVAREKARKEGFFWFIENIYRHSFPNEPFVTGDYIKRVAERYEKKSHTIDVTGRGHFKSSRVHADIMFIMFIDNGTGFEAQYFSFSEKLAKYQLKKLKNEIKDNPFFATITDLKPQSESILAYQWSGHPQIMSVEPRGLLSNGRGIHAQRLYIDDPLKTEDVDSPNANPDPISIRKVNDAMRSDIIPMIKPGGVCRVVSCVTKDTFVYTRDGIVSIGSLFPGGTDFSKQQYIPFEADILSKDGWDRTSHLYTSGDAPTNKITLSNGYEIECSEVHPLMALRKTNGGLGGRWVRSSELKVGDEIEIRAGTNIFGPRNDYSSEDIKDILRSDEISKQRIDNILLQNKETQCKFLRLVYEEYASGVQPNQTSEIFLKSNDAVLVKYVQIMLLNMNIISCKNDDGLLCIGINAERVMRNINYRIRDNSESIAPSRGNQHWLKIEKIEKSHAEVVDFVIPNTHSFISNGLVSHNTPQTTQDFMFDREGLGTKFDIWIAPAILDEANHVTLWPDLWPWERLDEERRLINDIDKFNREYQAQPASTAKSYIKRDKLIAAATSQSMEFRPHPELENHTIIGGFDVGKRRHPSHLALFDKIHVGEDKDGVDIYKYVQIFDKWMDKWEYGDQVDYLNTACEYFHVSNLFWDSTRGELDSFEEKDKLDKAMKPLSMGGSRKKHAIAANFGDLMNNDQVTIVNNRRTTEHILLVDGNLNCQEILKGDLIGHGDSFWSCATALWEENRKRPKIYSLSGDIASQHADLETEGISDDRQEEINEWASVMPRSDRLFF